MDLLTPRQAGEALDLKPASLRSLARRRPDLRAPREQWLDARTPMYLADAVEAYKNGRPAATATP